MTMNMFNYDIKDDIYDIQIEAYVTIAFLNSIAIVLCFLAYKLSDLSLLYKCLMILFGSLNILAFIFYIIQIIKTILKRIKKN